MLSGSITHRDSLGNIVKIVPGEVNWMTAGEGISHSETVEFNGGFDLEGLQVWVGLPEDKEDVAPLFQNYKNEIPKTELNGIDITVVAGKFMDYESPVAIFSELIYLDLESDENKILSHFQ